MPNEVLDTVHRLAAALEQAGGIKFTYKDSNIMIDDDDDTEEDIEDDKPIPIPTTNMETEQAIT